MMLTYGAHAKVNRYNKTKHLCAGDRIVMQYLLGPFHYGCTTHTNIVLIYSTYSFLYSICMQARSLLPPTPSGVEEL